MSSIFSGGFSGLVRFAGLAVLGAVALLSFVFLGVVAVVVALGMVLVAGSARIASRRQTRQAPDQPDVLDARQDRDGNWRISNVDDSRNDDNAPGPGRGLDS